MNGRVVCQACIQLAVCYRFVALSHTLAQRSALHGMADKTKEQARGCLSERLSGCMSECARERGIECVSKYVSG